MATSRNPTAEVAPAPGTSRGSDGSPSIRPGSSPESMPSDPAALAARSVGHASGKASSRLAEPPPASVADLATPELRQARKLKALEEILADAGSFADLPEEERTRLALYAGQFALSETPFTSCWAPGTSPDLVQAYLRVEQRITAAGGFNSMALRVADRWTRTATNSSGQGTQGLPVTLTWSIVPDGTPITPANSGESTATSSLRARMAAIYGGSPTGLPSAQPWFAVYQAVFDNLAAISGLRFVYEPNDDGIVIDSSSGTTDWGQLGVRGDIRISGHLIDGDNGVLAYAYYPDNGDVVIDTGDNYFTDIGNNSIRLRNIMEHEIGHSLGLAHVCPVNQTKLMEPFINTGFRGSQFDDIYSHQRNYGDPLEVHGSLRNNDTPANATPLTLSTGTAAAWEWLSQDGDSDTDHFSFAGTSSQQVTVKIIPSGPNIGTYQEGPQNSDGSCIAGTPFDPSLQRDLILDLLASNGTTVVASAPVQAAGLTEQITSFQLPSNGTYYIRVRGNDLVDTQERAQLYRMEILRIDAAPAPQVVIASTRLDAESNSGGNGKADPGETIRLGITLANNGGLAASNLTATLAAPAGSTVFTPLVSYGNLAAGNSAEQLFTFALAGAAGDVSNLQLTVTATGYSAVLPFTVSLGSSGVNSVLQANFDGSSSLPAGWTQSVSGGGSPWAISTAQTASAPNAAFSAAVALAGESILTSPSAVIGPDGATLQFQHRYNLESGLDGAVLEASRDGGSWFDLLTGGGTVVEGGYSTNIRPNSGTSISRSPAWSGNSGTFITTRIALPTAWSGNSIRFRWRLVHDSSSAVTGWYVDSVALTSAAALSDPFRPFVSLTTSASSLSEGAAGQLTLSTPLPLARAVTVTPQLSGTATAADLATAPSFLLPVGQTSVQVPLTVVSDGLTEGAETLQISIPSGSPDYAPAAPSSVSINITDGIGQPASITLSDLGPTYTGSPQAVTVSTTPAGLSHTITYDGASQEPTNAGSYAVIATITEAGFTGSTSGTLVIGKANAVITLGSLTPTFDDTPKAASATTSPAGLPVTFTYDGATEAPTNAGSYAVVATVDAPNHTGSASGTLVIGKANAVITLGSLTPTFDDTPKAASATTSPAGLPVTFTYDGDSQAPTNAGSYAVVATVDAPNHTGSASGTLVIVSAYTAWIAAFADSGDPDALPSGDLDDDGWDNAGEYAFGTLPDDPSSRPLLQPVLTTTTLRLMLPPAPPGIVRSAETSAGLGSWTTEGVVEIPGGFEVPRDTPQRFLRITYEVVN